MGTSATPVAYHRPWRRSPLYPVRYPGGTWLCATPILRGSWNARRRRGDIVRMPAIWTVGHRRCCRVNHAVTRPPAIWPYADVRRPPSAPSGRETHRLERDQPTGTAELRSPGNLTEVTVSGLAADRQAKVVPGYGTEKCDLPDWLLNMRAVSELTAEPSSRPVKQARQTGPSNRAVKQGSDKQRLRRAAAHLRSRQRLLAKR